MSVSQLSLKFLQPIAIFVLRISFNEMYAVALPKRGEPESSSTDLPMHQDLLPTKCSHPCRLPGSETPEYLENVPG